MSGLRLEGVSKAFDGVRALVGVDLEAADGELLVVLGPSGCGKSTLLRAIAGLEEVDAGRVQIGGRDVTALRPGRRNVSMVFQGYALFPHLSAAENIAFGLEVRDVPKKQARERVERAAALVGCGHLLDRRPQQLSGGERQRIALARALVREPDAFLLDEPLSNLDAELRTAMRAELKTLHAELAATMVYVTHDQTEALTLGDRIAVMREGAIVQVGAPDEVWRSPANRFVARFVGSPGMNILADGEGRELGIRPEHVRVGAEGRPAEVILVEPVGSEAYVHVRAGEHVLIARVSAELRPAVGDAVHVDLPRQHVLLFDARTGERLPES